jgi:hypothetical protein
LFVAALLRSMVTNGFRARFRIVHLFHLWALTVVLGFALSLLYAGTAGTIATVPLWIWLVVVGNGVAFALYFLLSGPVAGWLDRTDRMPTALERVGERLAAWDEAGRE